MDYYSYYKMDKKFRTLNIKLVKSMKKKNFNLTIDYVKDVQFF